MIVKRVKRKEHYHVFGGDKFGQIAEKFARFFGTPTFLVTQTLVVLAWIVLNGGQILFHPFDPFPYILLNLCFSTQAAYAAPLILLAQTRQADRDKRQEEEASAHRDEIADNQQKLLEKNTRLTAEIHELSLRIKDHIEKE